MQNAKVMAREKQGEAQGGNSLTFRTGVLMCLFGVCNLGEAKLVGVGNFDVPNVLPLV